MRRVGRKIANPHEKKMRETKQKCNEIPVVDAMVITFWCLNKALNLLI